MNKSDHWSDIEVGILGRALADGHSRKAIARILQLSGYDRSPAAVKNRIVRLPGHAERKLGRPRKLKPEIEPINRETDNLDVLNRRCDLKFQKAMLRVHGAGAGLSSTPGTEHPRTIGPAVVPIGGSSAGWGQ
jgi:hypothetical protein